MSEAKKREKRADLRGSVISNCFGLIKLLNRHYGATIQEIAEELGMSTRNAYRYIEGVSLQFPVWETRSVPKRYRLLKEIDF